MEKLTKKIENLQNWILESCKKEMTQKELELFGDNVDLMLSEIKNELKTKGC